MNRRQMITLQHSKIVEETPTAYLMSFGSQQEWLPKSQLTIKDRKIARSTCKPIL